MNNDVASLIQRWKQSEQLSLGAADAEGAGCACYCPTRSLSAFALLMAGHGRCVNTTMMLGDREYAMRQLARAHTVGDPELREVAARLFAYFDGPRDPAPTGPRR